MTRNVFMDGTIGVKSRLAASKVPLPGAGKPKESVKQFAVKTARFVSLLEPSGDEY
jgi:hypothetical protein